MYLYVMKVNKTHKDKVVMVNESVLLGLVADNLKDRVLFPEKIEETKKFLKSAKVKRS